jgi:metal-responsive CopG/Arc/MetJ family transcriptional regulator
MKTVQMTLDEELISAVDRAVKKMKTTRSEFTRQALRAALQHIQILEMESKHREGYTRKPVTQKEFKSWEKEQVCVE